MDALANSQLESFLQGLTTYARRPQPEHFWELVDPTKTWVITAARSSAPMSGIDGFAVEGHAAVALEHHPSVVPLGWLILHVDVEIRPKFESRPDVIEPIPLSLDDLFSLVYVPLTTLLDEIAPAVLPAISGDQPNLLAVGCMVMSHGDPFGRYVALEHYADRRISGSTDPAAFEWYPASLEEIVTTDARTAAVRERVEALFIVGGYRGFERVLQRLTPPALAPPAATYYY